MLFHNLIRYYIVGYLVLFFILILLIDLIGYIYSMPPLRLKTKPIGDILCNALAATGIFIAGLSFNEKNIDYLIIIGVIILAAIF